MGIFFPLRRVLGCQLAQERFTLALAAVGISLAVRNGHFDMLDGQTLLLKLRFKLVGMGIN